ncbi:MAG: ArsC/Spx/MgsR family protein [Pseudoruegeria sp.]
MKLYGLKACDTCRKALKQIKNNEMEVDFIDVRVDAVSEVTLARFLDTFGDKLINQRSTTWRGLTIEQRDYPPEELLALHPALMKRPVLDVDGVLYLGWTQDVQTQVLG